MIPGAPFLARPSGDITFFLGRTLPAGFKAQALVLCLVRSPQVGHFWWPLVPPQVTAHSQVDSPAGRVSNAGHGLWLHQPGCQWLNYLFSNCKRLLLGPSAVHFLGAELPRRPEGELAKQVPGKGAGLCRHRPGEHSLSLLTCNGDTYHRALWERLWRTFGTERWGSMGSAVRLFKTNPRLFPTPALGLRFEVSVSSSAKWG